MGRESKIEWLARQAKRRKSEDLPYQRALNQIAREVGLHNWADVLKLDEAQLHEAIRVIKEQAGELVRNADKLPDGAQ